MLALTWLSVRYWAMFKASIAPETTLFTSLWE